MQIDNMVFSEDEKSDEEETKNFDLDQDDIHVELCNSDATNPQATKDLSGKLNERHQPLLI
jgi:hypothetical protein